MSSDESDAPGGADDRFVLEGAVERKWPDHGRGRYFDRLMDLVQTRPPPRDDGGGADQFGRLGEEGAIGQQRVGVVEAVPLAQALQKG